MPNDSPFTRPTIIAGANLLTSFTHSEFDNLMLQFGLEGQITSGTGVSKQVKANELVRIALSGESQVVESAEGSMSLSEAIVRMAITVAPGAWHGTDWQSFCSGLERVGFVLEENDEDWTLHLRRMLPTVAEVPEANDEVHTLLEHYGFTVPLGHLRQAINAHGRGEWASANSQMRSFLEGLLDEIAERLAPERAATTSGGHGRRALRSEEHTSEP